MWAFRRQYPATSHFESQFSHMLETNSISSSIDNIISLLAITENRKSKVNRQVVYKRVGQVNDPIQLFKCCILIQKMICSGCTPDSLVILAHATNNLNSFQSVNPCLQGLYTFMKNDILVPYIAYLHRRGHDELYHERFICQSHHSSLHFNPEFWIEHHNKLLKDCFYSHINECYYYVNLMKKGAAFMTAIITFIRYYKAYYHCSLDFNLILADDLKTLYPHIIEEIQIIKRIVVEHKKKESVGTIEWELQFNLLLDEVERLNQELYLVFYNCYNSKYLVRLVPKFICVQKLRGDSEKPKSQKRIEGSMSNSTRDINIQKIKDIYQSKYHKQQLQQSTSVDESFEELLDNQSAGILDSLDNLVSTQNKKNPSFDKSMQKVSKFQKIRQIDKVSKTEKQLKVSQKLYQSFELNPNGYQRFYNSLQEGAMAMRLQLLIDMSNFISQAEKLENKEDCGFCAS